MENVLLGVGAMGFIIVVGLIISVFYSKNKVQGKASVWAFASLAIVFVLFCFIVVLGSQRWILPVFIIACTVVPIGVYVAVVARMQQAPDLARGKHTTSAAVKAQPTVKPLSSPVTHFGVRPEPAKASVAPSASTVERAKPVFASQSIIMDSPVPSKNANLNVPEAAPLEEAANAPYEAVEHVLDPESVVVYDALTVSRTETAAQPIAEDMQESEDLDGASDRGAFAIQPEESSVDNAGAKQVESEAEPFDMTVPEEEGAEAEPASVPEVESPLKPKSEPEDKAEPAAAAASAEVTYESCLDKAAVFKDKGLEGIAARLYKQASQIAPDEASARNALMLAMASYVNADLPHEAHAVAQMLSKDAPMLSPVQRMKLDAVMRLA